MKRNLSLLAILAAAPLCAQFQLSVPQGAVERPVTGQYDFGGVSAEDSLDVRFRARNLSSYQAVLSTLSLGGAGFTLIDPPKVPVTVESGAFIDFTVRFNPPAPGSYSAVLRLNTLSPILRGTGLQVPTLFVESASGRRQLVTGDTVDLGDVERKARVVTRFTLENRNAQAVTAQKFEIAGDYFSGGAGFGGPVTLAPGATYGFEVIFEPAAKGLKDGAMLVDQRRILFRANVVEPPPPEPSIVVEPQTLASAQQAKLSIRFPEASRGNWPGTATLLFEPALDGVKDSAVLFQLTNSTTAAFTITEGESQARFGARTDIDFQTGTTAGTLVVRIVTGGFTKESRIPIAPAVVGIDTARATRTSGGIEVYVAGFDNTRTTWQAGFTFYDSAGNALGSGTIRADVRADFASYFGTSDLGGIFGLRAAFPVTGDATRITGVEVELVNSAGTARSKRISF